MKPQVRRQRDGLQLSYDLPFRSSDAHLYPLLSPDGASILVYGHEKGLSVFKLYGESGKIESSQPDKSKDNATNDDTNRATETGLKVEKWLEVGLDSSVQRIAFPPVTKSLPSDESRVPSSLVSELIVAASCDDLSIYLVSAPLATARHCDGPEDKSQIKITRIEGGSEHQDLISALCLTWTRGDLEGTHGQKSRSRNKTSDTDVVATDNSFSFLIASASTTGNGLVVVHRMPFSAHLASRSVSHGLFAKQAVRLPLLGCVLAFNPAIHPSNKHLSLLLTSPAHGVLKIFDLAACMPSSKSSKDHGTLTDMVVPVPLIPLTSCVTFAAGFDHISQPPRRKSILDARWDPSGCAIFGLLADGEWGLWNVDVPDLKLNNRTGGGDFTVLGQLVTISLTKRVSKTKTLQTLAPITPHTRKTRSADLFGQQTGSEARVSSSATMGHITICHSVGSNQPTSTALILTYDGFSQFIPFSGAFIRSKLSDDTTGRRMNTGNPQRLPEIHLGGEHHRGTYALDVSSRSKHASPFIKLSGVPDLLVFTDTRFIIYARSGREPPTVPSTQDLVLLNAPSPRTYNSVPRLADEDLLGVEGIEKVLEGMDDADRSSETTKQPPETCSTLLDAVTRQDVHLSPSNKTGRRSKTLVVDRRDLGNHHSLFTEAS